MDKRIEEIRARVARYDAGQDIDSGQTCDSTRTRYNGYGGPDPCDFEECWACQEHDDHDQWREDVRWLLSRVEELERRIDSDPGAAGWRRALALQGRINDHPMRRTGILDDDLPDEAGP